MQNTTRKAKLSEIFSSFQGEGLYTGERMTFIRFGTCSLGCRYCDTPQGICSQKNCRIEKPAGSGNFVRLENPFSSKRLNEILENFSDDTISITGGEPLEQSDFLLEWLPTLNSEKRVLLETNGLHDLSLQAILPFVNVVSMDVKLPSSTGRAAAWDEHARFLGKSMASGKETYVKMVVTSKTSDHDIESAIKLLTTVNKYIPTFIQPASRTLKFQDCVSAERLESVKRLCGAYLHDVKVQPQMHKQWGVL